MVYGLFWSFYHHNRLGAPFLLRKLLGIRNSLVSTYTPIYLRKMLIFRSPYVNWFSDMVGSQYGGIYVAIVMGTINVSR